jgi:hypothetical protein
MLKSNKNKVYSVHMDLATDILRNITNLEMIKITYKVLSVGGKVNGMAPPMWLLLRSLCNAKYKNTIL